MRTKQALYNTIASLALQIVTFIAGMILPRLLLITYGSSINGLRTSLTQIINYFYVFEAGIGGAIMFSLYKPLADKNYELINSIVSAAKKSYKNVGLIFLLLISILAISYPNVIINENIDTVTVIILTLSIGATGIINYFLIGSYTALLTAAQLGYINSIARLIYIVVNTTIIAVLVNLKLNIAFVYFISISANLLNALVIRIYIKKKFTYLNLNVEPNMSALSKRYDVVFHQISGMIVSTVPILLLTLFVDLKTVSVYSIYSMIFSGVGMIIGVLGSSFTAVFGDLIAKKELSALKEAYSQYEFIYYGMISFVYSCALILGISFIKIYTKGIADANYADYPTLLLFTLVGILTNWKVPQSTIIISAGHYRETRHRAIIEACLIVLVSIPLVLKLELKGALIGSIIGLLYRSIDIFYAKKITKFRFKYTVARILRLLFIIIISSIPFKTIFIFKVETVKSWILFSIIVALWVGLLVIIINLIFERKTCLKIVNRFKCISYNMKF